MSHVLGDHIRRHLAELARTYGQRLSDVGGGYEQLGRDELSQIARQDLELIAQTLETGNPSTFLEQVRARIADRLTAGFDIEALLQALAAMEDTLWPAMDSLEDARFMGEVMRQARAIVAELTVQRLRESEAQYRMLADRLPVGVFVYQQDGLMRYAGDQAAQLLGYDSSDEMVGRSVLDFVAPDERPRAVEIVRRRLAGEEVAEEYTLRLLCKDGSEITALMFATQSPYFGQVAIQGAFVDISQQERQTRRLQRLARAVEATHDVVIITDPQGTIQFVNPVFERVTGYGAVEALGQNPRILKSGKQPGAVYTKMWQTISSGQVWQGEVTNRRKDGSLYEAQLTISPVLDEAGQVEQYVAIQRDITEQKRLQEQLAKSERQFRELFDRSPVGIFRTTIEGQIVEANPAFLGIVGYPSLEAINRVGVPALYADPADRGRLLAALQQGPAAGFEVRFRRADGQIIYVSIAVRRSDEGQFLEGILEDITARKALEQTIQESLERRGRQVQTSTEVAQEIAAAPALGELFRRVVTLIKERFGYYHAQIFRYELALDAVLLVTGYGETGEKMLAAGHRLEMGRGVVGAAAATGNSVLASDVTQDPDWVPNPFLPNTRGELAVPIKLRDRVLGILDVQSDVGGALSTEDQILLEGLCGQIAIAIESTRLRQETEQRLREMDALYGTMTRQAWQAVESDVSAYLFDPAVSIVSGVDEDEQGMIMTPVVFRGEAIGAVGVYDDPQAPLSSEEREFIVAVNEQAAQALESARLFEEARARAEELSVLNELSQALTAMLNVEDVLAETYRGVSQLMDAANFCIGLYDPEEHRVAFILEVSESQVDKEISVISADQGISGYIIRQRESVLIGRNVSQWLDEAGLARVGQEAASWLGVPLMIGDQVLGVMVVQSYTTPDLYGERDRDLLNAVASQAAIAIQNTRLFQETRRRAEEMTVLNELAQALSATLDVGEVLDETYRGVSRLLDATNFYIGLYDPKKHEIAFPLNVTESRVDKQIAVISADQGISGYIVRNRQPVLIRENVRAWQASVGLQQVGQEAACWLGVPLMIGDRVLGVMAIQDYETPRLYGEHDQEMLTAIASQAAIAIQNARSYEEARTSAEETIRLNELSQALSATLDLRAVMEEAYRGASRLVDTTNFYVTLYDAVLAQVTFALRVVDNQVEWLWTVRSLGRGGLTEHLIETRKPLLIEDRVQERIEEMGITSIALTPGREALSWLGVPIIAADQVLGTMVVLSYTTPRLFDEHDRDLLVAIASQTAIAVQNARLYEQAQTRAKQEAALREVAIAFSASEDLAASLPAMIRHLGELVPVDSVSLATYHPGDPEFTLIASGSQASYRRQSLRQPLGKSGPGWVITHKQPWLDANIRQTRPFAEDEASIAMGVVSRLILPLQIGERVIGSLSLSSNQPAAFSQEDIPILTQVADQVASALERKRLLDETRLALAEVEATNRRYLQEQWEGLLSVGADRIWGYLDSPEGLAATDQVWTPEIKQALASGQVISWTEPAGGAGKPPRVALAVPIRLRGQTIGVLDFYQEGEERIWTEDDKALVESLVDQLAQALETQRLFEQTQSRALRERLAGEIVSKIRSADDIQGILETAARELGRALGVSRALIRLEQTGERKGLD